MKSESQIINVLLPKVLSIMIFLVQTCNANNGNLDLLQGLFKKFYSFNDDVEIRFIDIIQKLSNKIVGPHNLIFK